MRSDERFTFFQFFVRGPACPYVAHGCLTASRVQSFARGGCGLSPLLATLSHRGTSKQRVEPATRRRPSLLTKCTSMVLLRVGFRRGGTCGAQAITNFGIGNLAAKVGVQRGLVALCILLGRTGKVRNFGGCRLRQAAWRCVPTFFLIFGRSSGFLNDLWPCRHLHFNPGDCAQRVGFVAPS